MIFLETCKASHQRPVVSPQRYDWQACGNAGTRRAVGSRIYGIACRYPCCHPCPPEGDGRFYEGKPRRPSRRARVVPLYGALRRQRRSDEGGSEQRPNYRPARSVYLRAQTQHEWRLHPLPHRRRWHRLHGMAG